MPPPAHQAPHQAPIPPYQALSYQGSSAPASPPRLPPTQPPFEAAARPWATPDPSGPPQGPGGPGLPSSPPSFEPPRSLPPLPGLPVAVAPPHPPRDGTRLAIVVGVIAAVIASVLTASLFVVLDNDAETTTSTADGGRLAGNSLDIAALLAKAQPSVVAIETSTKSTNGQQGGAGTGVVVSDDGYVLTNWHVVSGGGDISAVLPDGSRRPAQLVGSFPDDDIALVRVTDTSGLVPAELGSSADAAVGDDVVAIGNALNLGALPSVTEGIISAKDRTIEGPDFKLRGLIQTDAAINPGNSGGPLLNASGQVIGINTAIRGDAQNIGFSIPIDTVRPLIEQIKQGNGEISADSAFLGLRSQSIDAASTDLLDEYGVSATRGAFIVDVEPDSAAEASDLRLGDVIVAIDGEPVTSADDLVNIIRSNRAGDTVSIEFEREGRKKVVDVVLGSRSEDDGGD